MEISKKEVQTNSNILASVYSAMGGVDYGFILSREIFSATVARIGAPAVRLIILGGVSILNAKLNIKNKMNELQCGLFVEDLMIYLQPKNIRLEEVLYFFNECAKSIFGKIYERLDGSLLFEFFQEYESQRADDLKEYYIKKAEREEVEKREKAEQEYQEYIKNRTPQQIEKEEKMLSEMRANIQKMAEKNKVVFKNTPVLNNFKKDLEQLSTGVKKYDERMKAEQWKKEIQQWDGQCYEG